MDGVQTQDSGVGWIATANISMDAVSEVKVLLNNYQAEYGRMRGAGVAWSGSPARSDFHGSFSYFKRHEQFNATDFFSNRNGVAKARYRYNMFSYTIGGPGLHPAAVQYREKQAVLLLEPGVLAAAGRRCRSTFVTMPTALERIGDFSQSTLPNGTQVSW